ncbi:type II toxin-antitoxin system RelE/ParE family toxin [Bradyrhizobium iriomotense]|uniref:type II toxin-antitoxin system RelE/ParE family toxin n=1 Tax=Bradyrhizobium iriomotense TaxID=441950 RepID=UPI001FF05AAD|nr:type II toxin-antitoxin system RelE/ParE family toxin [Bradyrhizobium iriomotense]
MKLRFTPRATQDLISIAEYVRDYSPQGALRVRAAILQSLQNLVRFPRLGRPQQVEGVRKLVTRRYPYLVYYALDERPAKSSFSRSSIPHGNASIRTPEDLKSSAA